jgi:SAM-dependent methyltransferase
MSSHSGLELPPIPPFEMRQLVGPTDEAAFDNPSRAPIYGNVPEAQFSEVLDFGCGCGRNARRLLQQTARPRRYVGFDLHPGMIKWCKQEITSRAPEFTFHHHNVYNRSFNPGLLKPRQRKMPADDQSFSLVIAHSVFTHTTQAQTEHYLREAARVLRPDGLLIATWFLFEKRFFPMMHDFQNTLYINIDDPTNATIFDRTWLEESLKMLGLGVVYAEAPAIRGFQYLLHIRQLNAGYPVVSIPEDQAPFGRMPPPIPVASPDKVGR